MNLAIVYIMKLILCVFFTNFPFSVPLKNNFKIFLFLLIKLITTTFPIYVQSIEYNYFKKYLYWFQELLFYIACTTCDSVLIFLTMLIKIILLNSCYLNYFEQRCVAVMSDYLIDQFYITTPKTYIHSYITSHFASYKYMTHKLIGYQHVPPLTLIMIITLYVIFFNVPLPVITILYIMPIVYIYNYYIYY